MSAPEILASYIDMDNASTEAAMGGKLAHRIITQFGHQEFVDMWNSGKLSPEYLLTDWKIEQMLQMSESISNEINNWMLSFPQCRQLAYFLETSLHHGYNHFRRVEKFVKDEFANSPEMRVDKMLAYFAPSIYFAIRGHDLLEVYTGLKEHHDGAAAMFVFGILNKALPVVNETLKLHGLDGYLSEDEWQKQRWAAAYICLHHSKPEKMQSVDEILGNGGVLFDPAHLLQEAENMSRLERKPLEEFFEPFELIRDVIQRVRAGNVELVKFTRDEILAIQKATYVMAVADKMDSNFPSELSAARTFLVRPDRPFIVLDQRFAGMTIDEEYEYRIASGSGHESIDDFSRFLFEIQRSAFFGPIMGGVANLYIRGVFEKGQFMQKAIPNILSGNFEDFSSAYRNLRKSTLAALLRKAGCSDLQVHQAETMDSELGVRNYVSRILHRKGYRGDDLVQRILEGIDEEETEVMRALHVKYGQLEGLAITQSDISRIKKLVERGVRKQQKALAEHPGPISANTKPPWWDDGYYYLPLNKYRLTNL